MEKKPTNKHGSFRKGNKNTSGNQTNAQMTDSLVITE